jgi:AcrR family transcriptional regulator
MPPNRQTIPRAQRVAEILDAALDEFLDVGFDDATMAAIAKRAGMTAPNVHYYFPTKEALFAGVAGRAYDQLFAALDRVEDPVERLRGYVAFHMEHHAMRGVVQALAARSRDVAAVLERREEWLAAVAEPVTRHELDGAALVAIVTGLIEAAVPHPKPDAVLGRAVARLTR